MSIPGSGDEIVRGSLVLDVQINDAEITAAANRAATNFNQQFARIQRRTPITAGAVENINKMFGGIAKNVTLTTQSLAKVPAVTQTATRAVTGLSGGLRLLPGILSAVGSSAGVQFGAFALVTAAAGFAVKKLIGETVSLEDRLKILASVSVPTAEEVKKVFDFSDVDFAKLNNDIEGTAAALSKIPTLAAQAEAAATLKQLGDQVTTNAFGAKIALDVDKEWAKAKETLTAAVEAGSIVQIREAVNLKFTGDARERALRFIDQENARTAQLSVTGQQNNKIRQDAIDKILGQNKALDELNKKFEAIANANNQAASANRAYQDSLKGLQRAQESVNEAIREGAEAVQDAIEAANEANARALEDVADATENLTTAQERLNEVIAEGGEEELTRARENLADATERVADAEERRAEAAERLAELLQPATQDELAEATDSLTRAEIALEKATRARDEALAALNRTQEESIDLSGLSLDGLRSTLANARASAAAQRRTGRATEDQTSLQEDAVIAEISVRDAIRNVAEARQSLLLLEQQGKVETDAIRKARQNLAKADKDVAKATRDAGKDRLALQAIEAGNSAFTKALAAARKGVAAAEERVSRANTAVGKTAQEGQENVAKAHEDANARIVTARDTVTSAEDRVTEALRRQRDAQQEVNDKLAVATGNAWSLLDAKLQTITANETLIRQTPGLLESAIAAVVSALPPLQQTGGHGAPGAIQRQNLIRGINDLLRDPRLPFAEAFKRLGMPGFGAQGALIEGASGPLGKLMHVGEYGKAELLLPLTKPSRVWDLMSRHLPKYPEAMAAAQSALSPSGSGATASLKLSGARTTRSYLDGPLSERTGRRIADLLEQGALGDVTVNNEIAVTNPVADPALAARLLERQIKKTISRRR